MIDGNESEDGFFPPWPRHQPVAAAFLSVRWTTAGYAFALDTIVCRPGEEAAFYAKVDQLLPSTSTGVTYNGRNFDNRVLALQATRWRPDFALTGLARQVGAGRFEGSHCDLADQFGGLGGSRPVAMAELCKALDIPSKIDADGSQVDTLWRAGKYRSVIDYVAQDVICTAMLWWHFIAFQKSDERLLHLPLAELATWIEGEPGLMHLEDFCDCRPTLVARQLAPALRARAALVDAERRLAQERAEAAFAVRDDSAF